MYLYKKDHSFRDILEQKKVHWRVKKQNISYYVCMKERENADVWIENKYFGRIWVRLSWKLQYPWIKTEKIKISPIVKDRELLSPLKKEREQMFKSDVKESGGQKDQRVCIIKSTTLKTWTSSNWSAVGGNNVEKEKRRSFGDKIELSWPHLRTNVNRKRPILPKFISICWKSANHKCDEEMEFQIAFQSWLEVV